MVPTKKNISPEEHFQVIIPAAANNQISIKAVTNIFNLNYHKLRKAIQIYRDTDTVPTLAAIRFKARRLQPDQLQFLTDPQSLLQQMNWSLKRRTAEHNLRWPTATISATTLRKLYRLHRIKQRVLKIDISLNENQLRRQRQSRLDAFPIFLEAYDKKELVFYMDESVFSANQVNPKVWYTP